MRESKVGVGVIGVGGVSGYVHLPGLRLCLEAEIVALCDSNPDLLRQRAEEYDVARTFTEYNDLLLSRLSWMVAATFPPSTMACAARR